MKLWHRASFDLPRMAVEDYEESGVIYEYRVSAPHLVLLDDGSMCVAIYEEDNSLNFHAWVDLINRSTLENVTHWTELPRPPKEAK